MELQTAKQLAKKLREPTNRTEYVIRKFNIEPVVVVGGVRLFGQQQETLLRTHLSNFRIKG